MKRPLSITLFFFFTVWGTFKAFESLVRTIPGSQEVYAHYGLEWLYYAVIVFSAVAGVALIHALWKRKEWFSTLGTVWLGVGIMHTLFVGLVTYLNKPLSLELFVRGLEMKGRDTGDAEAFIYSSGYDMTVLGTMLVMSAIMLFFVWKLWQHRDYSRNLVNAMPVT